MYFHCWCGVFEGDGSGLMSVVRFVMFLASVGHGNPQSGVAF